MNKKTTALAYMWVSGYLLTAAVITFSVPKIPMLVVAGFLGLSVIGFGSGLVEVLADG